VTVALLLDTQGGRSVQEEQPDEKMRFEELPDGRVRATLTVGITTEMVRWILGWGPHCLVEVPADLRNRVRAMAKETARQYEGGTTYRVQSYNLAVRLELSAGLPIPRRDVGY